jgi:hypothetical protein
MQWIWAHFGAIRATLLIVGALVATTGLAASFTDRWREAAAAWVAAYLCKWVECWLMEKALVECQETK